jgi:cyanophycinase
MKNMIWAFAAVLFLLQGCASQQEPPAPAPSEPLPAGKLFIIGGGPRPPALVNRLIDAAGVRQEGYVVVLPMSSEEPDTALFYSMKQFTDLGLERVHGFNFIAGEAPDPARLDSLRQAKLIYISGGDQNKFMGVVAGTAIEEAIRACYEAGGTIAGTSAGAAVMSEKMITGNERKYSNYEETFQHIEADNIEIGRGLGFLKSAIVDQHFVIRSRHNRLISAAIEYPDLMGVGIDESTAILVEGRMATVVGASQVLVFRSTQPKRVENGKLGSKGLQLDLYLPGEQFQVRP